jgi:hypothetical protein
MAATTLVAGHTETKWVADGVAEGEKMSAVVGPGNGVVRTLLAGASMARLGRQTLSTESPLNEEVACQLVGAVQKTVSGWEGGYVFSEVWVQCPSGDRRVRSKRPWQRRRRMTYVWGAFVRRLDEAEVDGFGTKLVR